MSNVITIEKNREQETSELSVALEMVSFPVEREKLGFDLRGKRVETAREVVYRPDVETEDGLDVQYTVVSEKQDAYKFYSDKRVVQTIIRYLYNFQDMDFIPEEAPRE